MEITKKVLQNRIAGMTQQLVGLLEQVAQVRGAINFCNELMQYLDAPDPEIEDSQHEETEND